MRRCSDKDPWMDRIDGAANDFKTINMKFQNPNSKNVRIWYILLYTAGSDNIDRPESAIDVAAGSRSAMADSAKPNIPAERVQGDAFRTLDTVVLPDSH